VTTLTAVVPTYRGDSPEHLLESVGSIDRQTRPADEILVVADGPLTDRHHTVFEELLGSCATPLRMIQLDENRGAWAARNAGVEAAANDLVAFLDSDDIAVPHRFERQLALFASVDVDVVGTAMLEFSGTPDNVVGYRHFVSDHDAIIRYARRHNPVNQPTVMARREPLVAVGGYRNLLTGLEDYDLWLRLMRAGYRFRNLDEPLVLFRTSPSMYARRSGWRLAREELRVQRRWADEGLITRRDAALNSVLRGGFTLLPARVKRLSYDLLLRHRPHAAPVPDSS
jgi:glycosyltransferase involved in cell wall biosynthesis